MGDSFMTRLDRRMAILGRQIEAERAAATAPTQGLTEVEAELPPDVDEDSQGGYTFRCRGCDEWKPMEWDLAEDHIDSHYCGGSPRCCP